MSRPINPWKLTGYKAGQNVACRVVAAEPGGYSVIINKDNLPGFLPTESQLRINEELLAQFVCVHNNRILLSSRFSGVSASRDTQDTPRVDWAAQLAAGEDPEEQSQPDAAFQVWAQNTPRKFHLKRATDLLMPPMAGSEPKSFKIAEYDLEWLLTDLEGGMRTCCVKASNEDRLSRAAMLLYRGRAVGCIYGCKTMNDTQPTESSLEYMLSDMAMENTEVTVYDLPPDVTLAMSALFLGYPVHRSDDLDAVAYVDYLCNWFKEKGQTACLALSIPSTQATCLLFVNNGEFVGSFYVEDQKFSKDKEFVYNLITPEPKTAVEASILPPEMTSSAVRFGYSLSMAKKRQNS
jgi:hypothetical protein